MWFINQTGRKLKQLASRGSKEDRKLKETEYFQTIDKLLKEKSNIVSLPILESFIKSTCTSPDECQTLSDVLLLKLDGYIESNRRNNKMFKSLVIIDYILLNGASVFIDLFKERIHTFQMIKGEQKNLTDTADKEFQHLIVRKAEHIVNILKDKQLRLEEKQRVQKARFHILKKNKENLYNTQQHQGESQEKARNMEVQQLGRFGRIEKYLNEKLENLTIALIGLIDQDCVIYANSQANKQFMDKGQSIIGETEDESKQHIIQIQKKRKYSPEQYKKYKNQEEQKTTQPKDEPKKVVYQNLLGIQLELL